MNASHRTTRPGARGAGFTLVELLISVTLISMLLSAIALAMHASLHSYDENDKTAIFTQTTRTLFVRMRREMRTAAAVDFEAPSNKLVIIPPADGSGLEQIEYEYNSSTKTLYYRQTVYGGTTTQVVLDNNSPVTMTGFAVGYTIAQDGQGVYYTQRAVVEMTFDMRGRTYAGTCSATPRRNQY